MTPSEHLAQCAVLNDRLERLRTKIQRLREAVVGVKKEAKPAGRVETAHSAIEQILRTQARTGRRQ